MYTTLTSSNAELGTEHRGVLNALGEDPGNHRRGSQDEETLPGLRLAVDVALEKGGRLGGDRSKGTEHPHVNIQDMVEIVDGGGRRDNSGEDKCNHG